jgi:hypothetical protein
VTRHSAPCAHTSTHNTGSPAADSADQPSSAEAPRGDRDLWGRYGSTAYVRWQWRTAAGAERRHQRSARTSLRQGLPGAPQACMHARIPRTHAATCAHQQQQSPNRSHTLCLGGLGCAATPASIAAVTLAHAMRRRHSSPVDIVMTYTGLSSLTATSSSWWPVRARWWLTWGRQTRLARHARGAGTAMWHQHWHSQPV